MQAHGGTVTAAHEITEPPPGVVLFDTAPTALLSIYGDRVPARYAKALERYHFGPGVAKVDFVLSDEIPWTDPRLAPAPTLHMGGTREQMARAERDPHIYLCSSATPPGGGVHGVSGYYAARTVLRREFGVKRLPALGPT